MRLFNDWSIITVIVLFEPLSVLQDYNILVLGIVLVLFVSYALNVFISFLTELVRNIEVDLKILCINCLPIVADYYVLVVKAAQMRPQSLKFLFFFINQGAEFGFFHTIEAKVPVRAGIVHYFNKPTL